MPPPVPPPVIIVIVVVVVVGLILWALFKSYYRPAVPPGGLALVVNGPVGSVTATLDSKSWLFGTYAPEPSTVTFKIVNTAVASTSSITLVTTAASPTATDTVVGLAAGGTTLNISAVDAKGNAASTSLPVTVT